MVSGKAVVSCRKASPVLETAEEALNKVARSIDGAIERVRKCSRCGRWNDSLDATDLVAQGYLHQFRPNWKRRMMRLSHQHQIYSSVLEHFGISQTSHA